MLWTETRTLDVVQSPVVSGDTDLCELTLDRLVAVDDTESTQGRHGRSHLSSSDSIHRRRHQGNSKGHGAREAGREIDIFGGKGDVGGMEDDLDEIPSRVVISGKGRACQCAVGERVFGVTERKL